MGNYISSVPYLCYNGLVMSLVKKILEGLSARTSEGRKTIGQVVYHPYKMLHGDLSKIYNKDSVYQALSRAEKAGFVERRKIDHKTYIALTRLGKEKLESLKNKFDFDVNAPAKDWDGKYRLVFFDIPEKDRVVRDLLRDKLKGLGFIIWQKSVLVSKEDIKDDLRKFFRQTGLEDHVLIVETEDFGNDKLEYLLLSK